MKAKRILISDGRPPRKPGGSRKQQLPAGKNQIIVTSRQRNEAIGLVLIGTSAFSLSLLHYLNTSKALTAVTSLSVYFGMGVYIVPTFVGVWGIQRFLDRSFDNLNIRIAGCSSAMIFGLGLLGLEGGKLGTLAFGSVAKHFGNIPTTVLFAFFFMASVIFALDIVYKDLLMAGIVVGRIILRGLTAAWEASLTLLGMAIDAFRSTVTVLTIAGRSLMSMLRPPPLDEAREAIGKLLTFESGMIPATSAGNTAPLDIAVDGAGVSDAQLSTRSGLSSTPTLNNTPPSAGSPLVQPPSPTPESAAASESSPKSSSRENVDAVAVPATCMFQIHIQDLSTGICMPTPRANPIPTEPDIMTDPSSYARESVMSPNAILPSQTSEGSEEPLELSADSDPQGEVIVDVELEGGETDAPVSLDTHPIDRDLKNLNEIAAPTSEILHEAELPPLDLLTVPPERTPEPPADLVQRSENLLRKLEEFNIKAEITAVVEGPAVSRFELKPGPGVKSAKILSVANDIAMSLAASIRIEAPIPGKSAIGIEIPNAKPTPVFFYDLVKNENFRAKHTILNLALGKTISNQPVFANLADMPHLLIAGQTGAGKSVCINTIIASILFQARPDQVKLVMIDPKRVELSSYNGIPHLMAPVVTDPKKASAALLWAIEEMMRRYELMETCGVRNIASYNEDLQRLRDSVNPDLEPLPYLVLIVDELADLMMTASAEVEGSICRLAQMARAVGIHLVIATQRPSVDVLTGIIKANLPTRIAFAVASQIDSRTILDGKGAESLLGKGDMLFAFKGQKPLRIQGAYISDRELQALTDFVRSQGTPEYIDITPTKTDDDEDEDEPQEEDAGSDGDSGLMAQIRTYLATQDKTSTSMLQRKFKIGYNRAARIMDLLEEKGMVSPLDGSNKRRVLRKE
ncbi:DNA translocase FtsK [Candidatus Ozemobacteraceae bacterium]|nr:DNA translocase FtsK [Candidatus Ozemobacteraceae bacterium]